MSHAMSHAANFADNFPQLEWLKRLTSASKRLLGAAGTAMWKSLDYFLKAERRFLEE
jgi:hypothetical protein